MSNEMSLDQSITAVFYTVLMILILIGLKTGVFSGHKDDIGMVEKGIGFFVKDNTGIIGVCFGGDEIPFFFSMSAAGCVESKSTLFETRAKTHVY